VPVRILEQLIECEVEMIIMHDHTTTGYEPVRMQAREIKAEVEVTKQKCKVEAVCDICSSCDVNKLEAKS
jgi:hypothetical protein